MTFRMSWSITATVFGISILGLVLATAPARAQVAAGATPSILVLSAEENPQPLAAGAPTRAPAKPGVPTLAPRRQAGEGRISPATEARPILEARRPAPPTTGGQSPASAKPSTGAAKDSAESGQESISPIPDQKNLGPAAIEVTSFKGVTPGVSTREAVVKAWGQPKQLRTENKSTMELYAVEPFPHVEVIYKDDRVASVVIRLNRGFPASQVAEQLDLVSVQPVLVSNELGEILGQAYPERGVLFSFETPKEPGKTLKKVTSIILEPIGAEPFILRAETNLDARPEFSLHDLDEAVKLQPDNARTHWLRCRVLASVGEHDKAMSAGGEAVRLAPNDPRYLISRGEAMAHCGLVSEAAAEVQKALDLSGSRPHVRARALCLLGDLAASAAAPDFNQAMEYHKQALQAADALATSRHPAVRVAAKEVLIDAHLGAAHDIAWGRWQQKERIDTWIGRAMELADDMIKTEGADETYRFRVASRALAAHLGVRGRLDPTPWTREALRSGESLIAATTDASRKSHVQWQVAMALHDALQIYQARNDQKSALAYGEMAVAFLEQSGRQERSPRTSYLLGRLYFRLGAVYAIRDKNHQAALAWFEKAIPLLGKSPPKEALADLGGLGETFVSMGISYWESGHQDKAIALTQHGATLIEEAIRRGATNKAALSVPYGNLALMHRRRGESEKAQDFEMMAERSKAGNMR